MSEKTLINDLRNLVPDPQNTKRTKTARLKVLMPEIDAAINRGASHAEIVEKLNAHDFEISKATFQTCLRRIRKAEQSDRSRKPIQPVTTREVVAPSRSENERLGASPNQTALEQAQQTTVGVDFSKTMRTHIKTKKETA